MTKKINKRWFYFVSDPKYYNPNDWQNQDERNTYLSTDYRNLMLKSSNS